MIIDPEQMDHIPEPKILTMDPSEDQMLFGIPEDVAKEQESSVMSEDGSLNKSTDRKVCGIIGRDHGEGDNGL